MAAAGPGTRRLPIPTVPPLPRQAPADLTEVEERSLDSYDRIFGVIDGGLSSGEGAA